MKRCSKCDRVFEEDSLNFCRSDGSLLISHSASDEADTMFFPVRPISSGPIRVLPEGTSSIVVLPFTNLTTDPANEYLCVGLAEELAHALSRIEHLRVATHTSALTLKEKSVDGREIGRALNVEAVLQGSIRNSKTRMRITAQLVSVSTGYQLWSERFDRRMCETFDLKGEIALAVVKALELTLPGAEQAAVCKRHTENPDAHQLYLKGRFHAASFTAEGFNKAVDYLNQAIAEDPNYALAYAGLADAYYRASFIHFRPADSLVQMKAAAEKALKLDENLAEAHAFAAVITANYDRMPEKAEKGFTRALELAPNNTLAHQWYGCYLMTQGRLAAAIGEFCKARDLDPLSPILSVLMSMTYFFARQPEKALKHARKATATDDSFWLGYWSAALAYEQSGQLVEALGQLETASDWYSSPWITALRARVYAKLGRRHIAKTILDEANKKARTEWVAPYMIATVYFALDEIDRGFDWLEQAFEDYDESLNYMAIDPVLDSCRTDPRFVDLLRRVGLTQSNARTHFVVPVSGEYRSYGYLIAASRSGSLEKQTQKERQAPDQEQRVRA
jgi:TolB-like protein/Tfp pilus assembly protein PilF